MITKLLVTMPRDDSFRIGLGVYLAFICYLVLLRVLYLVVEKRKARKKNAAIEKYRQEARNANGDSSPK
jgi:hypothetical protein